MCSYSHLRLNFAGIVLHYLIRLEPFTKFAKQLQGGRFDKADRLFADVRRSWESASRDNLQDVRELTPEFFCGPGRALANADRFALGARQSGDAVGAVAGDVLSVTVIGARARSRSERRRGGECGRRRASVARR